MSGHIRQRGNSWEIRFALPPGADGKRRVETRTISGSKRDAQRALRDAMIAIDRGEHVEAHKLTVAAHVRGRIEQWQASGQIGGRTVEHYDVLAGEIARHLGDVLLQKLTTLHVEGMHTAMRTRGLTRTAKAAHALLARALGDAVKHRLTSRNAARDQGPPAVKRSVPLAMPTADQVTALLARLDGTPWRVPVVTALYTGLRRGEQLALRWRYVDLDRRVLRVCEALDETRANGVTVKAPKSAAGIRDTTLPAIVIDSLHEHHRQQLERCLLLGLGRPANDALVFPGPDGGHDSPRAFSQRWARMAARVGMPEITWHSLRHAHASMLIAANVPITVIAARLGHADPSLTLRVYSHLYAKDDAAAAAAIDAALG